MRASLFFLALFLIHAAMAQVLVEGRVVDARTNAPLPFVHLLEAGERQGTTTDIDGRFRVRVDALPITLRASYVGYAATEVVIENSKGVLITMKQQAVELNAVDVLPGENPAHRIIKRAYANRKVNDGMNTRAHRYEAYTKTVFTAAMDSALMADPARIAALDSNDRETYEFFERQHILLLESVTECRFRPPAARQEEVKAMRVSGLQDPQLLALAAETRTWSIYAQAIELGDQRLIGPLAPGSTKDYLFTLEDTLYSGIDSIYVISFKPRSGKKFDALKGLLYVNTNGYAIQNVIAEPMVPPSGIGVRVQQVHENIDGKGWFPVQLNNTLMLEAIQIDNWKVMGISRVYLKNIALDPELSRGSVSGPGLIADRMELRKDATIWDASRAVPLDAKDSVTYHVIDSIGKAEHLDRRLQGLSALLRGSIAYKFLDIPLDRIVRFNDFEGFRLGLGLRTNARLSRYFSLGGYFAYGFKDRLSKYGGEIAVSPWPNRGHDLKLAYANDVVETGGWGFPGEGWKFGPESYRWLYVGRMDRTETISATFGVQLAEGLKVWLGTEKQYRVNEMGYRYEQEVAEGITRLRSGFQTGAVTFGLRYAFRERTARLPERLISLGAKGPVMQLMYWHAVDGLWEGEHAVWRLAAQIEKRFQFKRMGLTIRVLGGMADPNAPMPYLFNPRGTWTDGIPMASAFVFETMRPSEFLADRFAALHLRHDLGRALYESKNSRPAPTLVGSAILGSMERSEAHRGLTFTPMNKPYYEAGLQLDDVLRSGFVGIGVGAFYRLGKNAFGLLKDDLAVKFTVKLGI